MDKILISGGEGSLAREFVSQYQGETIAPKHKAMDVRHEKDIEFMIKKFTPDIFLHLAVDKNEQNHWLFWSTNYRSIYPLTEICNKYKVKIVYLSTDYVFNGRRGNYTTKDIKHPFNVYGATKSAAEDYLLLYSDNYLIIRTSFIDIAKWNFETAYTNKYFSGDEKSIICKLILENLNKQGLIHIETGRKSIYDLISRYKEVIPEKMVGNFAGGLDFSLI